MVFEVLHDPPQSMRNSLPSPGVVELWVIQNKVGFRQSDPIMKRDWLLTSDIKSSIVLLYTAWCEVFTEKQLEPVSCEAASRDNN